MSKEICIAERRGFFESLRAHIAQEYLRERSVVNAKNFDQQVVFSFDWIGQSIALNGLYERAELEFISNVLRPLIAGKTILDIGANIGNHTRVFAKIASTVMAFEPNPRTFEVLRINTAGIANVSLFAIGASDTRAKVLAHAPIGNAGGASIDAKVERGLDGEAIAAAVEFLVMPLDTLADVVASDIGFIKIDVEGHELNAFRGMEGILVKQSPIIAFEQNTGIEKGTSDVVEYLRSLGYGYLYELVQEQGWYVSGSLPRPLRRALRAVEAFFVGVPNTALGIRPIARLQREKYNLLFASKQSLEPQRAI